MKRLILSIILITFTSHIHALEVTIDGLSYYLNENNHEAIVSNGNKWHGNLHVPSVVTYDRQTYKTTGLNWNAFHECSELTDIKIPQTIEDVTHYSNNYEKLLISSDLMNPFVGCTALESIEVDENNPSMKSGDGVLFSKDGTRLYAYPSGTKATSYVVPQGVTWIGINALANTNLKKIDLPKSVQTICHPAFSSCSLDEVVIRGILDEQSVNSYLFYGLSESAKLYVPTSEINRYKSLFPGDVLPLEEYIDPVTFTEGQMATIILPVEPDASKGKYYRLDRVEGKEIIFEQELQPRAHVPYIIVPNEDFSIDLNNMDLEGCSPDTVSIKVRFEGQAESQSIYFIGSYVSEELEQQEGCHIRIIDTTPDCSISFSEETGKETFLIGALRAYLTWDDPYNQGGTKGRGDKLEIVLRDYGTDIKTHSNSPLKGENKYDLSGKKLSDKPAHGLYIENGKKQAVR